MKKIIFILFIVFTFSCKNETVEIKKLSDVEQAVLDSISKTEQKIKGDSMKKKNSLLILPPDSNYTGDYTDKYPNGITKFKGFYRFGKRHGHWMSFYPNGIKWSELFYDKGLRQGPNTTFFENGKIRYAGFYKNDLQDSVWDYYDTTGKVAQKILYKDDRMVNRLPLK